MLAAWNWLVANNLLRDVISWGVFTCMTAAWAFRPWRKHRKDQQTLLDLLNTATPGGLHDVLDELKKIKEAEDEAAEK